MKNTINYCRVCFSPYQKSYYYKTFDDEIMAGDLVVVPVGEFNNEQMGIVKTVETVHFYKVPYPLPKTKTIIRKENIENYPDFLFYRDMVLNYDEDYESDKLDISKKEDLLQDEDFLKSNYLLLCSIDHDGLSIRVWAELQNGCLSVSGQEIGSKVKEVWGDLEYEYFYKLDFSNTEKLFDIITTLYPDVTTGLLEEFSGEDGCLKLRKFCEQYLISYSFYNYV